MLDEGFRGPIAFIPRSAARRTGRIDVAGLADEGPWLCSGTTATQATMGSFVTVFPYGLATPNSSNLNFGAGETIPNLVMVGIGGSGQVDIANEPGTVHLVSDAVGHFAAT